MEKTEIDQYFNTQIWFVKMTSNKKTPCNLTSFERELFGCIKSLSTKRPCTASDKYFAEIFNVSIKHVNTSINKLKEMGIITVMNSYKKRCIKNNVEKDGAFYFRDDSFIYFLDSRGLLKIPVSAIVELPDNFHKLPRNNDVTLIL